MQSTTSTAIYVHVSKLLASIVQWTVGTMTILTDQKECNYFYNYYLLICLQEAYLIQSNLIFLQILFTPKILQMKNVLIRVAT